MAFGDANRDRRVDGADFLLWQRAFVAGGGALSVPEPGAALLIFFNAIYFSPRLCRGEAHCGTKPTDAVTDPPAEPGAAGNCESR